MLLIGDSSDPSGNGMFSKTGRKLNKFFMNLNNSTEIIPKLYFNKMKLEANDSKAFRIRNKSQDMTSIKNKAINNIEPFARMSSRQYFQNLELKKNESATYGNYNPKIVNNKVKILRMYRYEDPSIDRFALIYSKKPKILNNHKKENDCMRYTSYVSKINKLDEGKENEKKFMRITGFVNLNKQLILKDNVKKCLEDNSIEALNSFNKTQTTFINGNINYNKIPSRESKSIRKVFVRNNYALNIKYNVVEKNLSVKIPIFEKELERPKKNEKPSCLFKGYYDYDLEKSNKGLITFDKMLPRSYLLF